MDEVNGTLQQEFEGEAYALTVLFRDEQQRILNRIAESAWGEAEAAFGNLYPPLMSMIRTLVRLGGSLPAAGCESREDPEHLLRPGTNGISQLAGKSPSRR